VRMGCAPWAKLPHGCDHRSGRRTAVERQQWGKLSLFIRQLCSLLFQFG
jgi:hypothetical protein